jgi:hypothetical protein
MKMTATLLGRFSLHAGELLRLDLGRRIGLRCGRGRLWVTAGGEGRDHELCDGQHLDCAGGVILVEGEGELLVERARARSWLPGREHIELFPAPANPSPALGAHHV